MEQSNTDLVKLEQDTRPPAVTVTIGGSTYTFDGFLGYQVDMALMQKGGPPVLYIGFVVDNQEKFNEAAKDLHSKVHLAWKQTIAERTAAE